METHPINLCIVVYSNEANHNEINWLIIIFSIETHISLYQTNDQTKHNRKIVEKQNCCWSQTHDFTLTLIKNDLPQFGL